MNSNRLSYIKNELLDTFLYVYKYIFAIVMQYIKFIYSSWIHKKTDIEMLYNKQHSIPAI